MDLIAHNSILKNLEKTRTFCKTINRIIERMIYFLPKIYHAPYPALPHNVRLALVNIRNGLSEDQMFRCVRTIQYSSSGRFKDPSGASTSAWWGSLNISR